MPNLGGGFTVVLIIGAFEHVPDAFRLKHDNTERFWRSSGRFRFVRPNLPTPTSVLSYHLQSFLHPPPPPPPPPLAHPGVCEGVGCGIFDLAHSPARQRWGVSGRRDGWRTPQPADVRECFFFFYSRPPARCQNHLKILCPDANSKKTIEKPYSFAACGKTFSRRCTMKQHTATHRRERSQIEECALSCSLSEPAPLRDASWRCKVAKCVRGGGYRYGYVQGKSTGKYGCCDVICFFTSSRCGFCRTAARPTYSTLFVFPELSIGSA